MEPTILENLDAVTAANATLTADLTAANALLAEAQAKATADAETIRALTDRAGALAVAVDEMKAAHDAKDAELAEAAGRLKEVSAQLKDATDKLSLAPFKDAASAGIDPIRTSIGGETSLSEQLAGIKDPVERSKFRAANYAGLMNEQKPTR
jgi:hypothetical protein